MKNISLYTCILVLTEPAPVLHVVMTDCGTITCIYYNNYSMH